MSQSIFLTVKGEKQGVFSGEERDGTIECIFYDHSLMSPRDPSTSLSSGTIKHAPVMMRKQVDSTSPLFANALTTNETLESVVFRFVPATHSAGMPPAIYFVRLSNASIASFRQLFSETPAARYVGWQLLEEVGFHYHEDRMGVQRSSYRVGYVADWAVIAGRSTYCAG